MESRWSLAERKARFCKGVGMSEALTRTLRRSWWSCCSTDFFFCIKLLRNLLRLSSSNSAPSICLCRWFTLSYQSKKPLSCLLWVSGWHCLCSPYVWKNVSEKKEKDIIERVKREGADRGVSICNVLWVWGDFDILILFVFSFDALFVAYGRGRWTRWRGDYFSILRLLESYRPKQTALP